jgi:2',3'-cyclic-nucleotide 2'-phosphodiesterase (5'-nucleotidase family)
MLPSVELSVALLAGFALCKQPTAPEPFAAPLRELEFGQLNFLHTTDTHGWHAGHLLEPSFGADWGDYVDFASRLREKLESQGKDLLVVDTGDRVEGNGLYDASEPKGLFTFDIFREQHMDIICSGNHELYKQNSSENEYLITVPAYAGSYLASNLDIRDPATGQVVPLAPRAKKFVTKNQGIRIMAFGFLYNFDRNANNTVVQRVEHTIQEPWFQAAIRDREIDLFLVIGHVPVRSQEFDMIYRAIRAVQWDTPIQFFGGHYHIRDYHRFDSKSYGLASGRFMETLGFQSISGLSTNTSRSASAAPSFFRRYIDSNLYSLYHHSGHNASTFHSDRGRNISQAISEARAALDLDQTFGCAPRDLWMARAPYPSKDSIFSWLEEDVFPGIVEDTARSDRPRLVISNTGAIRFDIFKGAFTKDSTYIVCPFTSGFHYLKDVPYQKAKHLINILNRGGEIFENVDPSYATWKMGPPEQISVKEDVVVPPLHAGSASQAALSSDVRLTPGYTTHDDAGADGDDTIHSPISFYRVPNCIQSTINPHQVALDGEGVVVDVVFNEFIQPWILLALKFLGLDYADEDVDKYMPDENLTTLIAKWVSENWKDNCRD